MTIFDIKHDKDKFYYGGGTCGSKEITISADKTVTQKNIAAELGTIASDPVFNAVHGSGVGFFGKSFPSPVLQALAQLPDSADCALLPILTRENLALFLCASSQSSYSGVSPHHYLELLSWMLIPEHKRFFSDAATEGMLSPPDAQPPDRIEGGAPAGKASIPPLKDLLDKIDDLPPLPSLASRTLNLLSDPETPAEQIESVITQDQAMVAKLIKVSNSALYCGVQKVNSLKQALARLGAKTTKGLILAASTKSYFMKNRRELQMLGQSLWQHAVACALASRKIAAAARFDDPEQAFIGGIMHDIGKLVIVLVCPEQHKLIRKLRNGDKRTDYEAEMHVMGTNHAEIGKLLMQKWHMPADIISCVEFHHAFDMAGVYKPITAIVAYANHLCHARGSESRFGLPDAGDLPVPGAGPRPG